MNGHFQLLTGLALLKNVSAVQPSSVKNYTLYIKKFKNLWLKNIVGLQAIFFYMLLIYISILASMVLIEYFYGS